MPTADPQQTPELPKELPTIIIIISNIIIVIFVIIVIISIIIITTNFRLTLLLVLLLLLIIAIMIILVKYDYHHYYSGGFRIPTAFRGPGCGCTSPFASGHAASEPGCSDCHPLLALDVATIHIR